MNQYCVIGSPINHSLSPKLHNFWFNQYNLIGNYGKEEIDMENLNAKINHLKETYTGFNITYPLKGEIIQYIDHIDKIAEDIGSVNTIKKVDNKWFGYNTDVEGMKKLLEGTAGEGYYILGNGNMAKTTLYALDDKEVTIVCRDTTKGKTILTNYPNADCITFTEFIDLNIKDHVIINTLPLDLDLTNYLKGKEDNILIDSNYNKQPNYKIKIYIGGIDLLILQAIEAFYIWTGVRPTKESANEALALKEI